MGQLLQQLGPCRAPQQQPCLVPAARRLVDKENRIEGEKDESRRSVEQGTTCVSGHLFVCCLLLLGIIKNLKPASASKLKPRFVGTSPVIPSSNPHLYPWLCSIRTRGFRGQHRCGATLLSGPPGRTVIVAAAHCNFLCKDSLGHVLEPCCCRDSDEEGSCKEVGLSCYLNPRSGDLPFSLYGIHVMVFHCFI